ncbi:uroporphyrinogen-III synthase [Guyparkeria hydrothermalis]|uniref:uroporphyrinogen-III synthase n=1 Tax=Guyparkeria hydrothermalis TaxID=923 RepID=UPI002020F8BF|nr:uroporphyrinogen-III synthase [Guyparkeria hydrothermalis]
MSAAALPTIREIVLTRPEGSNAELREALTVARPADLDGPAPALTTVPLLAIRALAGGGGLPQALAAMQPEDLVVFVSPRAVSAAAEVQSLADWPARHVAAVGEATGRALAEAGREDVLLPAGSQDSEGLLERLEGLSMTGRRVWIIRGETGRELLAEALAARGARPHFVAVYRRECAQASAPVPAGGDRLWIVTAPQALDCLAALDSASDGEASGLLDSTLLVINDRARDRARSLGFRGPVALAGGPAPATLARAAWNLIIERQSSLRARP